MEHLIFVQASLIGIFLFWGSYQDYVNREVEDYIWGLLLVLGGIIDTWIAIKSFTAVNWILWGLNALLGITIGLLFFYVGAWGGADSKALMVLSLLWPFTTINNPFELTAGIAIIGILGNTFFFMIGFAFFLFLWNSFLWITKGELFVGVEASLLNKILALISCLKVTINEAEKMKFVLPAEQIGKGKVILQPGIGIVDEEINEEEIMKQYLLQVKKMNRDFVWVRPLPPGIIFIFLGWIWFVFFSSPLFYVLV